MFQRKVTLQRAQESQQHPAKPLSCALTFSLKAYINALGYTAADQTRQQTCCVVAVTLVS